METSLHRQLKQHYADHNAKQEVKLGRFRIDVVNPDQLGALMLGAQYHAVPQDPSPVIAPFGSGCMQLVSLFENLGVPQAMMGSMGIAMRQYLPAEIIAFTVTKPMFERLCSLDERSFLSKPFWERLQKDRKS